MRVSDFRFSFNIGVESREAFVARCQAAEGVGYDAVYTPDHLDGVAPFPPLVAAAEATEHLQVGTLVLNVPFWNTHLLAREIATTDLLTDGRLEVGLGAGHMKWEFDAAAIPWEPFGVRADRLEDTIKELGAIFASGGYGDDGTRPAPKPMQRRGFNNTGPPVIVGGTGDRILRIAAEHADIIGIAGVYQVPGQAPGTFRLGTAAEAEERVRFTRDHAGERADTMEWQALVQMVIVTDDRRSAADQLLAEHELSLTRDELLETPFLLIGTVAQIAGQLRASRERYGFTHFTVHDPYMETFAPVIEHLR